jgi:MerR family transcriptional regulator, copper efflux regulator
MRIGELAETVGANTSRIRFYEAEGLIPTALRSANGYRDYPDEAVQLIRFIERAQLLGFALKEILPLVRNPYAKPPSDEVLISALRRKLHDIDAHIDAVIELRANLLRMTARIEARRNGEMPQAVELTTRPGISQQIARCIEASTHR